MIIVVVTRNGVPYVYDSFKGLGEAQLFADKMRAQGYTCQVTRTYDAGPFLTGCGARG